MSWLAPLAAGGTFVALLLLETLWPLRRPVESKPRRIGRNLALLATSAACVAVLQAGFLAAVIAWAEQHRVGLLWRLALPGRWRVVFGALALDYTLWHWHRWNHVVPFLWRFHVIHHADRDLDASTGARFHFGEMSLSVGYRALQMLVIGADATTLAVWNGLLIPAVLFHHSNLRLPPDLDRLLVPFIVTPRMHTIHHSNWGEETNSNWSSLLSIWDRLHGTLRLDVPPESVEIGVPAYVRPEAVTLGRMLSGPFLPQPDYWQGRLRRALPAGPAREARE
jgi:sterol desaturase/sphingolipid hydroxylase (fatty acid hydroxylase superfamily)